jgi:hypothetical protein
MSEMASRVENLRCCVCGGSARGRQWFNRDEGYGICRKCVDYVAQKQTEDEIYQNYGVEGIHYNIVSPRETG